MKCTDLQQLVLLQIEQGNASDDIESHLKSCSQCQPLATSIRSNLMRLQNLSPEAFFDGVQDKLQESTDTAPRSMGPWLALAATLLVIAGLVAMQLMQPKTDTATVSEDYPTNDLVLFIDTLLDDNELLIAILHELKGFEIVSKKVGDTIGDTTVTRVDATGVGLKRKGQDDRFYTRQELQSEFDQAVTDEFRMIRLQIERQSVTSTGFTRLQGFASMGMPEAVAMLRQIAESNLEQAAHAKQLLAHEKDITNVDALVLRALNPQHPYRQRMIKSLGSVHSPMTLDALSRIALNKLEDTETRGWAVDALQQMHSLHAANILQRLLEDEDTPTALREKTLNSRKELLRQWATTTNNSNSK